MLESDEGRSSYKMGEVSCGIGRDWGCDHETVRGQIVHPRPAHPGPSPQSGVD